MMNLQKTKDRWSLYRFFSKWGMRGFIVLSAIGPAVFAAKSLGIEDRFIGPIVLCMATLPLPFVLIATVVVTQWKCPACRRSFFVKWYYSNPFAQNCVHCGLKKWQQE